MAEEQREQNQGFFSKVLDGTNRSYDAYRNTRMAANAGKQLGKQIGKKAAMQGGRMAATGIAGATSEIWVPVVIVGLIIVVIIVVFFGGVSGVKGGDLSNNSPSPSESSNPPGVTPTCTNGDIASCLKNDFHIIVTNATTSQMNDIYNIFALPMSCPIYKQLLLNGSYLTISLLSDDGGCHGYTPGPSINIYNYSYCQKMVFKNRQYLLIHESGHAIKWRNPRVQQNYVSNAWKSDSGCYDSGYLKTYPLRCGSSCGISPDRESFAESIADTIMCSDGGTCQYAGAGNKYSQPIYNFPSACPTTNNWTNSNIF